MCNEPSQLNEDNYRFLDYRLDQLEFNLRKGQEKLEKEYKESNKTILDALNVMQEGLNTHNKTIVELNQRLINIEEKSKCIDKLKEVATENRTRIKELERRIDIYKQILFFIGTTAGGAFILALFELIKGGL